MSESKLKLKPGVVTRWTWFEVAGLLLAFGLIIWPVASLSIAMAFPPAVKAEPVGAPAAQAADVIAGSFTFSGDKSLLAGSRVDLVLRAGGNDKLIATGSIGNSGEYSFGAVKKTAPNELYYVRFNNSTTGGTLRAWYTSSFTYGGGRFQVPAANLTDVALGSPGSDNKNFKLPLTLNWTPRTPPDSYAVIIYRADGSGVALTSGNLGNAASYTISNGALPAGEYFAEVAVSNAAGSGLSQNQFRFRINLVLPTATPPPTPTPEPTATSTPTPRPTATPTPTATPEPSATPRPTSTPTATAVPALVPPTKNLAGPAPTNPAAPQSSQVTAASGPAQATVATSEPVASTVAPTTAAPTLPATTEAATSTPASATTEAAISTSTPLPATTEAATVGPATTIVSVAVAATPTPAVAAPVTSSAAGGETAGLPEPTETPVGGSLPAGTSAQPPGQPVTNSTATLPASGGEMPVAGLLLAALTLAGRRFRLLRHS